MNKAVDIDSLSRDQLMKVLAMLVQKNQRLTQELEAMRGANERGVYPAIITRISE